MTKRFLGLLEIHIDSNASEKITKLEEEIFEMVKNDSEPSNYKISSLIFVIFEVFQTHSKSLMFEDFSEDQNFEMLKLYEMATPNPNIVAKNFSISKILNFLFEDLDKKRINKQQSEDNNKIICHSFKHLSILFRLMIDSKISFSLENGKFDINLLNKYLSIILYYASRNHHIKLEVIESNLLFHLNEVKNEISTNFSQIASFQSFESLYKIREVLSFDREYIYFNCCHKILESFHQSEFKTSKFHTSISSEKIKNDLSKLHPQISQEAFLDLCYLEKNNKGQVNLKEG